MLTPLFLPVRDRQIMITKNIAGSGSLLIELG